MVMVSGLVIVVALVMRRMRVNKLSVGHDGMGSAPLQGEMKQARITHAQMMISAMPPNIETKQPAVG